MYSKRIIPVLLLVLGVSACQKANEEGVLRNNRISFGASTEYENFARTRTEYSGLDENDLAITSSSQHERIDWVADKDRIQILCNQTRDVDDNANPSGTFKVVTASNEGDEKSYADVEAVGGTPFYWGSGMHYFYALYPAAGTTSNYHDGEVTDTQSAITSTSATTARIDGTIPAAQSLVKSGNIYKPNMNYAYMYAATKTEKTDSRSVVLSFTPLVTSFEFQLKALDDAMASSDLTTLTLSSTTSSMTGAFSAALDLDGTNVATVTPASGAGKTITVSFPAGTRLSKTDFIIATALALGVEQTNLTLTLAFANGTIRSLVLNRKSDSQPVTVAACKKVYFQLGVDAGEWDYFIGDLNDITLPYYGGSGTLGTGFVSYRRNRANPSLVEKVPFVFEYAASPAGPWTSDPQWVVPTADLTGYTTGATLSAKLAPQLNTGSDPHHDALQARTPANNFDLSTKNVATGATVARTTANCYVVDAPGTYRFPLVYGNGVKGGGINSNAYRGRGELYDGGYWPEAGALFCDDYKIGYFRDHADAYITDPYIANKYSSNLNAVILWTDAPHLVTNAGITGSGTEAYLTFSVPQETITQGNALVAVRSGNTVLWSWHIWVTDTNLAAGISANGKVFSPANLGWCDGKSVIYAERTYYVRARQPQSGKITRVGTMKETGFSETYKGNNTYYQWGRKDPMQAGDGKYIGSNGSQNFKYYYSETGYAPVHNQVGKAANLGTAIQNPHREYRVTNAQDNWLNTGNTYGEPVNIWDSGVSYASATYSDRRWGYTETYPRDVDKTVYDPCPVGYKVPNVNSFTGFTTSNLVWTNNYNGTGEVGRYYTGNSALFFPADGGYSQSLIGVALEGSYWCATAAYTDGADMFNFSNSAIRTGIISNSFQFVFKDVCWAVRPIRE